MMDTLRIVWDLVIAQCVPSWREGAPTFADYALVGLIVVLFALACWQCARAIFVGDDAMAMRIKSSILTQGRSDAD
jgi:hypothetical protein